MPKKKYKVQDVPLRKSIFGRAFLYSVSVTAIAALSLSICSFFVAHSLLRQRVIAQLSSIVTAKEQLIEQRLQTDRERVALLSSRTEVRQALLLGRESALAPLLETMQDDGVPALGISVFGTSETIEANVGLPVDNLLDDLLATTIIPIRGDRGWQGHTVYSPIRDAQTQEAIGMLAVRYSVDEILNSMLQESALGITGEVLLGILENENVVLLNHEYAPNQKKPLILGPLNEQLSYDSVMAQALAGNDGIGTVEDYRGNKVFAAYRSLPSLGWGLVVKVDKSEAMRGVMFMAMTLFVISIFLIAAATGAAYVLSQKLTGPLQKLSVKVQKLGPGKWKARKTVHSGDEVEILDTAVADMAKRLQNSYEYLEDEVLARTEELKEQYLKDRTILDTIEHGVVLVNAEGNITDANPAAVELLKCEREKCRNEKIEEVFDVRLNHRSLMNKDHPVIRCLRTRRVVRSEPDVRYSAMRSDKILIPILLVIKPLIQDKELIGAVVVFQDVTEERKVDYLKSEFISLASHQLRTPLSSMQWYIELFRDEQKLSKAQKEYLEEMSNASNRMVKLIESLLHAARLEGGNLMPRTQELDVTTLVSDLAEELRSLAKEKKISCHTHVPSKSLVIETDSILLHIVFKNLFSNAVKYTMQGGEVSVEMKSDKNWITIDVSDNGIGIPKEDQKRVFQRLFRASNVQKLDTDGNGLGLFIARMIVENLDGTLTFKSTEGSGSVFTVRLPLKKKQKKKQSS